MDMLEVVDEIMTWLEAQAKKSQHENVKGWDIIHSNNDDSVIEARLDFHNGDPFDLLFVRLYNDYVMVFEYDDGGWDRIAMIPLDEDGVAQLKHIFADYF